MTASRHVRSLRHAPARHDSALGSIRRLDASSFPILERVSIKRLELAACPFAPADPVAR